ncbi:Nucleic acid-binding [Forsythia ovata]|uniref:Nucleic acid-binding n=1 Tax=Forsythia ovata TaxID=205694 RepID=A0ABD1VMD6_9LAMI
MSMNADDRYEDALRKKELKNKRRRELYAKSQQEKNMQQPQSDCNSTFLVDENTVPRNRRRRAVSATKTKQVAKEIHGENIQIRQRKAKVHVQVEDHTGCVSANMIGETAETFLQCSGQKLMQIAALKNQAILNDIRASTTEEHMLYLKVINNNKKTVALKYDVVFMLEPILDINTALNIGENPVGGFMVEEKTAPRTCINKQPIKAYAQPMLSPTKPVSSRTNAIHTCFQTNTVIASRNITDLRLVANIANQSDVLSADY